MVSHYRENPNKHLSNVELLTRIVQHCNHETQRNILTGLQSSLPDVVSEIRKKIVLFEDLAYADADGIQKLIKMLTLRDLATAVYGSSKLLIENIASNLSQNRLRDFKAEVQQLGTVSKKDVDQARMRVMNIVSELIISKNLFINRSSKELYI